MSNIAFIDTEVDPKTKRTWVGNNLGKVHITLFDKHLIHYLQALEKMIKSSNVKDESVQLTEDQNIMLSMSEIDIENGNVVEQDQLNERELKWLKEKPA